MEKLLRSALTTLGCQHKEAILFLAAYARGSATLSELISASRLQRSTAYLIVKDLVDKGLFTEDHKAYGKTYTAVNPETLVRMVAARQRQIGRQHLALQDHLGELQALYGTNETRPRVRTYQGANGLISVWRDILTAQDEILIWTNQATESQLFDTAQHDQFITERQRSGTSARVLSVDNPKGRALQKADNKNLRQTKLLPSQIIFSAETYIYGNRVAVLDYDQDIIGIITESRAVASAQRAMFESAWCSIKL